MGENELFFPMKETAPDQVGMCSKRLKRVGTVIAGMIDRNEVAGMVVAAVRRGQIPLFESFGMLDAEKGIPMRKDAIFRIYSMTKPITAVATLMLYEECAFFLDEPVSVFLPEFANLKVRETAPDGTETLVPPERPVTIHDLLTHTGGLSYAAVHEAEEKGIDLEHFPAEFCTHPLDFQPGTRWQYSASNDVLGALIQKVSDRPFDEFLRTRIFDPLGMSDTDFRVPEEKHSRLAQIYRLAEDGRLVPLEKEDRPYCGNPVFLSGGGGLVSTACDYLRFARMLLGRGELEGTRILSPKTIDLMAQDHLPPGSGCIEPFKIGYGLGVSVVRSLAEKQGIGSVGEFGWGGAAGTEFRVDPRENMAAVFMLQLKSAVSVRTGREIRPAKRVKNAIYQAIIE